MISEKTQIGLIGIAGILGGVYVLVRRRSLAKANAKYMAGRYEWTGVDYSEEYFRFLGTVGGIFFIFSGVMALLSYLFRDSQGTPQALAGYAMYGILVLVFIGGIISILYTRLRFRNKK